MGSCETPAASLLVEVAEPSPGREVRAERGSSVEVAAPVNPGREARAARGSPGPHFLSILLWDLVGWNFVASNRMVYKQQQVSGIRACMGGTRLLTDSATA